MRLIRWSRRSTGVFASTTKKSPAISRLFTVLSTLNRAGALCQAGHPTPFIICRDGELRTVGLGGVPVGLFPQSEYQSCEFSLAPGERLYLYSDGISECENRAGELYGETRLQQLLTEHRLLATAAVFQRVERELGDWSRPSLTGLQSTAVSLMTIFRWWRSSAPHNRRQLR